MIFEEIINTYNTYLYSRSVMIDTKQFGDNHSLVLNIWSKNFVYWGYFVMLCLGYVLKEIVHSLFTGTGAVGLLVKVTTPKCIVKSFYEPQGLYSLSGKTSYRQISWSLEAARLDVAMVVVSLWNLTGTSAAVLPRYLPNFRAIGKV